MFSTSAHPLASAGRSTVLAPDRGDTAHELPVPRTPRLRRPGALLALLALAGSAGAAAAQEPDQDTELDRLRERVDRQERELVELRDRQDALEVQPEDGLSLDDFTGVRMDGQHEPGYGSEATVVSIHGFLHSQLMAVDGTPSTFDLHHAFLFFGADIGDYAQAWTELEFEHGAEEHELDQAELRFFLDETTLAVGRFYGPFGIERRYWYHSRTFFETRPDVFRHVVPGNWYETGVRVDHRGTLGDWGVRAELSLTNGLGEEANTDVREARESRDANGSKALIGRLGLSPTDGLSLGLSLASMTYARDDEIDFLGLDLEYTRGPWILRTEAVQSTVEDSVGAAGDFDREGLYVLLSREMMPQDDEQSLRLSLRYDLLDGNDRVVDDMDYGALSIAAAWHPLPHVTIIPEARFLDGRHGGDPTNDYAFLVGVTLDF